MSNYLGAVQKETAFLLGKGQLMKERKEQL